MKLNSDDPEEILKIAFSLLETAEQESENIVHDDAVEAIGSDFYVAKSTIRSLIYDMKYEKRRHGPST